MKSNEEIISIIIRHIILKRGDKCDNFEIICDYKKRIYVIYRNQNEEVKEITFNEVKETIQTLKSIVIKKERKEKLNKLN